MLNNYKLQNNTGVLIMSPLQDAIELDPPPLGGYIFIRHIPDNADLNALYELLRPCGPLYSCHISTNANGQLKGIAHACFVEQSFAESAIAHLNFSEFLGNVISIQPSHPPRRHSRPSTATQSPSKTAVPSISAKNEKSDDIVSSSPSKPFEETTDIGPSRSSQQQSDEPKHLPAHEDNDASEMTPPVDDSTPGNGNGLGGVVVPGKLFITNLHPTVSHKELFALFKKYGYIQLARVSIDPTSKKSRGHGIVQFSDPTAALDALKACQGTDIKGRKITMYQYEHVNRQQPASPRKDSGGEAEFSGITTTTSVNEQQQQTTNKVPFPRSDSVSSTHSPPLTAAATDPLLDPNTLRNLSESSRGEILVQKLMSEISSNTDTNADSDDVASIAQSLAKRPLEDILAMLSDPKLLASEWGIEKSSSYQTHTDGGDKDISQRLKPATVSGNYDTTTNPAKCNSGGIQVKDYSTETEDLIESLMLLSENERKKKLGSKLFPLIKGLGYKESTKLTVWILTNMSHDVRSLAYALNDQNKLGEMIREAQRALGLLH